MQRLFKPTLVLLLSAVMQLLVPLPLVANTCAMQDSQQEFLASEASRRSLRNLVDDVARLGLKEEVEFLSGLLLELGDTPKDHQKLRKTWERELKRAKPNPRNRAFTNLTSKISKVVDSLEHELELSTGSQQTQQTQLAQTILSLDRDSVGANQYFGNQLVDDQWHTQESQRWQQDSARISELVREARNLEIVVAHGPSSNACATAIYGDSAHQVSAMGVVLHGGVSAVKLERILREALRAMALSNAVLGGDVEVPDLQGTFHLVLLKAGEDYGLALAEARDNSGLSADGYTHQTNVILRSFQDFRGWRTSRWRTEAAFQSFILWHLYAQWLGENAQPCLVAGHLNWLCLNFFGTSVPTVMWKERDKNGQQTVAVRDVREGALWRSAASSLFGCRAWMKARMRAGDEFPYALAIVDKFGKISAEPLLKATLMNEYLQARGELRALIDTTRVSSNRVASIEAALGRTLPELEDEWTAWLFNEVAGPGLVQRLTPTPSNEHASPENGKANAMLQRLNDVRKHAFSPLNVWTETVSLFDELSAQCELHAQYLVLNPEQGQAWPDAHEEYADQPGFSPEGAWAGLHSVINFTPDPVASIDSWMGTFYHRLPLLEPGLFGVGYGNVEEVTVLDTSSLVAPYWETTWITWPPRKAKNIPLTFQPELPNPVPGEDQSEWGYPITLQAYWPKTKGERTIKMSLFHGDVTSGEQVDCHYLTPTTPVSNHLAPSNAFCLIPKQHLTANTTYSVYAICPATGEDLSWSFTTQR
jgi:hypothetical protein